MITLESTTRFYLGSLGVMSHLPPRLAFALARRLGTVRYEVARRGDQDRVGPLSLYIGSRLRLDPEQADACLRRSFELAAREDLEGWLLPRLDRDNMSRYLRIEGLENLDTALERGRGVVLFGGHATGARFFWMGLARSGYRLWLMGGGRSSSPPRSTMDWFLRRQFKYLEVGGCQMIHLRDNPFTMTQAGNALKRNEILGILTDANVSKGTKTIEVEFLHEVNRFAPGGAVLAATTGAALLPYWPYRENTSGPLVAKIGPPLEVGRDPKAIVQQQANYLEAQIVRDPANWTRWQGFLTKTPRGRVSNE